MDIKNKNMLLFCVTKAYEEFIKENRRPTNSENAYYLLGALLTWVICCYERIKETHTISDELHEKMRGLYFPNNCLKHNKSVLNLHSFEPGRTIPCRVGDPLAEYRWADLDYVSLPEKYSDMSNRDKGYYNTYYRGKSIERTLEEHIRFIKNMLED